MLLDGRVYMYIMTEFEHVYVQEEDLKHVAFEE